MAPMECARCLRISSKLFTTSDGKAEGLCKKCVALHDAERIPQLAQAETTQPFVGYVRSSFGPLGGVFVTARGQDIHTVTNDSGAFSFGSLGVDCRMNDVGMFFEMLRASYPGGGEAWLREAMVADPTYEKYFSAVVRHSDIGAVVDKATFVALLLQPEVWPGMSSCVYQSLGKTATLVLTFSKPGFAPCSVAVVPDELANVEVEMRHLAVQGIVDTLQGGQLQDPVSGASVTLPAGARLLREDGSTYSGNALMSLAVIDATDPDAVDAMPGDYSAVDFEGNAGLLETFGAMWIGLEAENGGGKLQLAQGSPGLSTVLPSAAPVHLERLGKPPSLWIFEEASGRWVEDTTAELLVDGVLLPKPGEALRQEAEPEQELRPRPKAGAKGKGRPKKGGGDEYHQMDFNAFSSKAMVSSPEQLARLFTAPRRNFQMTNVRPNSYWNCDAIYITAVLSGTLLDASGHPIQEANVWSVGQDYAGASPRAGLKDGRFGILAQGGCQICVNVFLPAGSAMATEVTGSASMPLKLSFGPFATGKPGESTCLGALSLSEGRRVEVCREQN